MSDAQERESLERLVYGRAEAATPAQLQRLSELQRRTTPEDASTAPPTGAANVGPHGQGRRWLTRYVVPGTAVLVGIAIGVGVMVFQPARPIAGATPPVEFLKPDGTFYFGVVDGARVWAGPKAGQALGAPLQDQCVLVFSDRQSVASVECAANASDVTVEVRDPSAGSVIDYTVAFSDGDSFPSLSVTRRRQ